MDSIFAAIATVITALGAAVAGVLIALSKFRAAEALHSRGTRLLRRVWDFVEHNHIEDQFPNLLRRQVVEYLTEEGVPDDDLSEEGR